MASILLITAVIILIIFKVYSYMFYKPPNFPPGPPRIPFFGSYIFILLLNYKHTQKAVATLCKYYKTNVLGFYFGPIPTLIVNDAASVKELLNRREMDGRPDLLIARLRDPQKGLRGVFFTDGPLWHQQRRYTLRNLRDFGFGRRFTELELEMKDEIKIFIEQIKSGPQYPHEEKVMKDGNILCPQIFFPCFANCFLKVLCNERLPRKEYYRISAAGDAGLQFQRNGDDFGRLFSLFTWLPDLFPNACGYNAVKEGSDGIYEFLKRIVDEHIATYDDKHERNFIDMYIKEMKADGKNGKNSTFFYEQFMVTILDFFFPSLTALGVTVALLIQRLSKHPEIVEKIQTEISDVVGQGRLPELDDRINMPYTEACIREGMRTETLVPSGLPHRCLEDTTFQDYFIPKNSLVVTVLTGSHYDPSRWIDPENFRPERYLDYNGKLSVKKDYSLPFGAGKRLCAGETFARNALFLFVSALFQNFNFAAPENHKIPDLKDNLTGIIITPPDYWLKLIPR